MDKFKKKVLVCFTILLFIISVVFGVIVRILEVYGTITSGVIYYICLIGISIYTIKVIEKRSLQSVGFELSNILKNIVLGIVISIILLIIINSYFYFLYGIKPNFVHLTLTNTILTTLYYICIVGFVEELIFRGYLLERLKEIQNSNLFAVIISSFVFALWHYPVNYYWGQVIFTFFFGIILSTIRIKTKGNILVSLVIVHGLYNSFPTLVGYFIK